MIKKNTERAYLATVATLLSLIGVAFMPGAQAKTADTQAVYYATVNKGCGDAGPGCGNLSIFRSQVGKGNEVSVALYHWKCLGFRGSPSKFRWVKSREVKTSSNRFSIKIDRPRIKLKVRGRFVGRAGGVSEVKGTITFRNLNRKCGFSGANFRQRESGEGPDPQG